MGEGKRDRDRARGRQRERARLRPRHSAGQARRLRQPDQHRRQVQRRRLPVLRRAERRRHQGRERAVVRLRGDELARREVPPRARFERGQARRRTRRARAAAPTARSSASRPISRSSSATTGTRSSSRHRLRYYAYLNSGLTLVYNGKALPQQQAGLADLLADEIGDEPPLYDVVHCQGLERLEFAFTHTPTTTARPTSASSTASTRTTAARTRAPSARGSSRA